MKKLALVITLVADRGVGKAITYKAENASDLFIDFITDYDKYDDYNFYGKYKNADYRMYAYLSQLDRGAIIKDYFDTNELDAIFGIETALVGLESIVSDDDGGTVNLAREAYDNIPKLKAMRNELLFPLVKASPELAEDLLAEISYSNDYITYDNGSDYDNSESN